jgi:cytochrome c
MASLELNKISAAILTAGVIAMGAGVASRAIYHPHELEEAAIEIEGVEVAGEEGEEPAGPEPVLPLLAEASVEEGESGVAPCTACHSFEEGGAAKVGPPLYGVVGRDIASVEGFSYSAALQEKEGEWDYEKLNHFLTDPRGWAPGTSMAFAGLRDVQTRADVIAYLRSLAAEPAPLPTEEEIAAVQPAAEGEGEAGEAAAGEEQPAEGEGAAAPGEGGGEVDIAADFEQAAQMGEQVSRRCAACHTFDEGGANRVGPNLWDVVGRDIASVDGFSYSPALEEKEGEWTYENLNEFLLNPREWAPGTKMVFAGLQDEDERAAMIAYLRSLSNDPAPLPEQGQ